MVDLERLASKVLVVRMERLVYKDQKDLKVRQEGMENLEFQERKAMLVTWVKKEHKVNRVPLVLMALREKEGLQDPQVMMVKLDQLVL